MEARLLKMIMNGLVTRERGRGRCGCQSYSELMRKAESCCQPIFGLTTEEESKVNNLDSVLRFHVITENSCTLFSVHTVVINIVATINSENNYVRDTSAA